MFRTVLVPLDGSSVAEQALPYALGIVRRADAILDLIHIHVLYALNEPTFGRYSFDPALDEDHRRQEQLYLESTAKWLSAVTPVPLTTAVLKGRFADGILERLQSVKADLIVMTTHGRGAVGRFFLGSVADEVIRRAPVPVLLVRPRDPAPALVPEPLLEHVLVPLDGSPLSESVLESATALIRAAEGRCTLLRVLEPAHSLIPGRPNPPRAPEQDPEAAQSYLETIAGRLRAEGLLVQTRVVVSSHVAAAILEEAQKQGCDWIALATHGRGGVRRLLLGSVADKVVRGTAIPVLVYRPPE